MYKCPVCTIEVNVSIDFLNVLFRKMKGADEIAINDYDGEIKLKGTKDKTTGEIKWKKRVTTPFVAFMGQNVTHNHQNQ